MLSGVLHSDRAIAVNIEIMRTFVELRRVASSYDALQERLEELEREMTERLDQHDEQLAQIPIDPWASGSAMTANNRRLL